MSCVSELELTVYPLFAHAESKIVSTQFPHVYTHLLEIVKLLTVFQHACLFFFCI